MPQGQTPVFSDFFLGPGGAPSPVRCRSAAPRGPAHAKTAPPGHHSFRLAPTLGRNQLVFIFSGAGKSSSHTKRCPKTKLSAKRIFFARARKKGNKEARPPRPRPNLMHLFIWEPLFCGRRQKLSPPCSAPAPAPLASARFGGRSQGRADLWRPDPSVDHAARALKIQMRAIVQVPRRRGPQGATTDDGPPKLGSALLRADAPLPFTAAPPRAVPPVRGRACRAFARSALRPLRRVSW